MEPQHKLAGPDTIEAGNGEELARALSAQVDALAAYLEKGSREAVWDLYAELVEATPKDTCRAAAGYVIDAQATGEAPPEGEYAGSLEEIAGENRQRLDALPPGSRIVLSNAVDYLNVLENGHSRQAPGGFIALAARNFELALQELAEGKK